MLGRRTAPRPVAKFHAGSVLLHVVRHQLKLLWSPQQIARKLPLLWPNNPEKTVFHETIYNGIYLHSRGERKRELIACLRHHNQVRKPCSRGIDRRGQIPDIQSIYIRPPEIEDRLIPAHWEGDLIKGAGNSSSVDTRGERTTGFVMLAKMDNATTKAVVDSITAVLNREPAAMCKTMAYNQCREMHGHKILTERTGCRSTSPSRTALGNAAPTRTPTACCARTCQSCQSTGRADAIALALNMRSRARLEFESPLAVYTQHISLLQHPTNTVH